MPPFHITKIIVPTAVVSISVQSESSLDGSSVENGSSDVPYGFEASETENFTATDSALVAIWEPDGATASTWLETCVQKLAGHAGAAARPIEAAARPTMAARDDRKRFFDFTRFLRLQFRNNDGNNIKLPDFGQARNGYCAFLGFFMRCGHSAPVASRNATPLKPQIPSASTEAR